MGLTNNRNDCPGCGKVNVSRVLTCKDYTVSGELFEIWHCAHCTLRFTQGIPAAEDIGRYYQADSYISHTDTSKGLISQLYKVARNYTLNWKMKLIRTQLRGLKTTGTLLDIGSGTGAFLDVAAKAGWTVTGLEPDEGARKICREKYQLSAEEPGRLYQLEAGHFDVITMWHVLEHVHDLHGYLDQIQRLLKKDGKALIAIPNYTSRDAEMYQQYWAAYDVPRHLYHFSPASLKQLVAAHGLRVSGTKPMWLDAFYIAMLSESYKKGTSHLVSAVWNGLRSNLHAASHPQACSSLVYLVERA